VTPSRHPTQPSTTRESAVDPAVPLRARRPPTPAGRLATVTQLVPAEEPGSAATVQGMLALDLAPARAEPRTPELRVVPGDDPGRDGDLRAWAARFAQATVEVLGGDRPLTQLLRWTSGRVYADLERRVRILGRTAPAPQRLRTVRPQVRSVHVFRPGDTSAEVSVHVRHGQRSRALAARLEVCDGRWRCVALQLG